MGPEAATAVHVKIVGGRVAGAPARIGNEAVAAVGKCGIQAHIRPFNQCFNARQQSFQIIQ